MTDSGFDLGLSDPGRAGVFFVSPEDLDTLEVLGRDAGLLVRRIDLLGSEDKAGLLLRFAVALDFPPGSGHNWDALSDSLRDLSWLPAPGYMLLLDDASGLHAAEGDDFDTLLSILDEAREDWAGHDVPFWCFVALDEEAFEQLEQGED